MIIVDGHEDLAWNALTFDRDYTRSALETRATEEETSIPEWNGDTLLGWPEWVRGDVAVIFATLFSTPLRWKKDPWDVRCYADTDEAHALYRSDLAYYQRLVEENAEKFHLILDKHDLGATESAWQKAEDEERSVGMVLLMEGADGVRSPGELQEWFDGGVRILGPAWAATRYAGGTGEPGPLTDLGRELLDAMAEVGMILDLAHLAEEGAIEALDLFRGSILVSHTSPLTLVPSAEKPERHITDIVIRRTADREGVIGLLLGNRFLKDGWEPSQGREIVTLADVATGIDYICQMLGDAAHVGLGSDFDGGFGLDKVPQGLDSVADLRLIGESLDARGYNQEDIEGILGGNWLRFLRRALPEN